MRMNTIFFVLVIFSFTSLTQGNDPFESLLRADCYQPIPVKGCADQQLPTFGAESDETSNFPATKFMLFNRNNSVHPEPLHECGGRLPPDSIFDKEANTKVLIHGFLDGSCNTAWMREIRDELLKKDRFNVILMDWTWGNLFDYYASMKNVPVVGNQLAFVIKNIISQSGVEASSFHLIGSSLGAQIAGIAGGNVEGIGRITGLDPAGPGYVNKPPSERLDPTDALIVDNIHSNSGDCNKLFFGFFDPLGHADFYPNGGQWQQSCVPYIVISLLKLDIIYALGTLLPTICSHAQSIIYFKTSINPGNCQFVGVKCDSYEKFQNGECGSCDESDCAVMGMDYENFHKAGSEYNKYYLNTEIECPYCDAEEYESYNKFSKATNKMDDSKQMQGRGSSAILRNLLSLWKQYFNSG